MWPALLTARQPEGEHALKPSFPISSVHLAVSWTHTFHRPINVATRARNRSPVTFVTSASLNGAMFARTRSPISRLSHSPVS